MKCISLWQPWASHIAFGNKKIETRSWSTGYRGPLLIHAAKRTDECSDSQKQALPFGAIVCLVDLVDCRRTEDLRDSISEQEHDLGNYGDGRFGWVMANVRMLATPLPYKGAQGFFDVPDELVRQAVTV